jgi:type II secretory pathway component PulF
MLEVTLVAIIPIAIVLAGVALLWYASQRHLHANREDVLRSILLVLGWFTLGGGLLIAMVAMSHLLAILLWIATLVVIVTAVVRYFASEQESLLWILTVAAERGIPLESAARAFGEERQDRVGQKARLLADYLEAGVPLALALKRSRNHLPDAALLAADLGEETGSLGPALRQAAAQADAGEATLRSMLEGLFYVAFLLLFSGTIIAFITLKIVPVLSRMFSEFELELPQATVWLAGFVEVLGHGWALTIPLALLWVVVVFVGVLWYMGLAPRSLPIINRLWWSADCALVMRWLATAIRQGRPISDVLRTLAVRYPHAHVRSRLEYASSRIDRGADWADSLQQAGLIRKTESALFKSATRAGNLPWALEEMAASGIRRSVYRIRAWLTVALPVLLLLMGGLVLFIALGIMMPLIGLIGGLS